MGSTYDDLLKVVKDSQGFHRTNMFKVELGIPEGLLQEYKGQIGDTLSLLAFSAPIPGFGISSRSETLGGEIPVKHGSDVNYNDITIGFYVPKNFVLHEFFKAWKELIASDNSNVLGYYQDYTTDITIVPMSNGDVKGRELTSFTCVDCWPTTVGDIDMNYQSSNELSTLLVSFTIRKWE